MKKNIDAKGLKFGRLHNGENTLFELNNNCFTKECNAKKSAYQYQSFHTLQQTHNCCCDG